MNSSYASSDARPSAAVRGCLVVAAALLGAAVPGRAGAADLDQLANLADQVQQAAWSQAAGAAQMPTTDVGQTVAQVTHAALSSASSAATTAVVHETVPAVVADATETDGAPPATPRAAVQRPARARPHEKARPREAAAAASPIPVSRPTTQVDVRPAPEPGASARERGGPKRTTDAPGAAREPRAPSLPFDLPPLPLPFATPSSVGAGPGGGMSAPAFLVALTVAFFLFVSEVVIRRVPSRRPARPRLIVLPPWRPG
ncbi:MAG TPA: hypothetical protein VE596_08720 [Gaiellaceae bacterium]|jgi:hypothetical protein|nr:hypothetical protein [Gaiellaceae bacterium]